MTLQDIYLALWDEWKPKDWYDKLYQEKDLRSGNITTYDCTTEKGKLHLVKQYLIKIHNEPYQRKNISNVFPKTKQATKEGVVFPTDRFRELRERIGYAAGTQRSIIAGYGSGSTSQTFQSIN